MLLPAVRSTTFAFAPGSWVAWWSLSEPLGLGAGRRPGMVEILLARQQATKRNPILDLLVFA